MILTQAQIDEERAVMQELLSAHPRWGRGWVSIRQCLTCRKIPRELKRRYMDVYHRNNPTSLRLDDKVNHDS